jgi:hypothetical protein
MSELIDEGYNRLKHYLLHLVKYDTSLQVLRLENTISTKRNITYTQQKIHVISDPRSHAIFESVVTGSAGSDKTGGLKQH